MGNSQNFNQIASDKRWVNLMGAMKGVRQEISTLAAHPDRPDHKGPLSVQDDSRAAANDDRNAALGSMLIEAFIGAQFGVAIGDALNMPEWAKAVDWGNAVDVYDEYRTDQGSHSDNFNKTARPAVTKSAEDMAWDRYLQDLPNRRVLEQNLSALSRAMDRVEQDHFMKPQKMAFSM
ncbi:MAG: hypothetical protein ACXW4B_10585 [Micavibrio sp.]